MASHAAISIDDDIPPGKAAVALRAPDHETSRRGDVVRGYLVEIFCWNHRFDNPLGAGVSKLVVFYIRTVLRGDNHALDLVRLTVPVLQRRLGLAVGPKKISFAAFPTLRQVFDQTMG